MSRPTTPARDQGPSELVTAGAAAPLTPSVFTSEAPMRVQRKTPRPSTPSSHRRVASIPRTSRSSTQCTSSPATFTTINVRTAKCSACDERNMATMLRCPGCTFQVCKPCCDKREQAGKSLAHGNMMTSRVATPGTESGVVRRKPVAAVKGGEGGDEGVEMDKGMKSAEKDGVVEEKMGGDIEGKKRTTKPVPRPKPKAKQKRRQVTPPDDSSTDEFAPDPASPTASKRRRTQISSKADGTSDAPSPFLQATEKGAKVPERALSGMTTDELLAHHGVNTPESPYKAHLLSRHEPVVSNPVIEIPELVKRGFRPRATAKEIQQNIQAKVREVMGRGELTEGSDDK